MCFVIWNIHIYCTFVKCMHHDWMAVHPVLSMKLFAFLLMFYMISEDHGDDLKHICVPDTCLQNCMHLDWMLVPFLLPVLIWTFVLMFVLVKHWDTPWCQWSATKGAWKHVTEPFCYSQCCISFMLRVLHWWFRMTCDIINSVGITHCGSPVPICVGTKAANFEIPVLCCVKISVV